MRQQRNLRFALALSCIFLPAFAAAQGQTVEQVIDEIRLHGYDAPSAQIKALETASDRPGDDAPVEAKRRYFAAIGQMAAAADNAAALGHAIETLETLGKTEACKPCAAQAIVLQANWELTRKGAASTSGMLQKAEETMSADAPADAMAHFYASRSRNARLSGNFVKSVEDAVKALRIADQEKNAALQVEMNITLALDNASLGDFPRADRYIKEAIEQATRIGYGYQLAYGYLNLGHISSLRGNREAQREALATALRLSANNSDLSEVRMIALSNLADYHLERDEFKTALDYAEQAAVLARSLDEQRSLGIALTNQGIALSRLGQVESGIALVKQAIAIATRMENREHMIGMTHELVNIYEQNGRYKEAVEWLRKVAGYEKELTGQERQRDVLVLQEELAAERKQQEIDRLSAVNARQQVIVETRNAQRWMWLAVAMALAMATFYLVRRLRGASTVNQKLSRTNEELEEQTSRDPLTGAYNRRHFQNLLLHAADAVPHNDLRKPQPFLSLVVLDLDHFKNVNDTYGHEAGDAVLVEVAHRLHAVVRTEDAVVRWGGEEFVLVLPSTGADGGCTLVTRVLESIGSNPVTYMSHSIPVTASAGCATTPESGARALRFALQMADLALYRAKAAGRNRAVCVSEVDGVGLGGGDRVLDLGKLEASGHVRLHNVFGPGRVKG